jgi:hypothetical protein
MMRKSRVKGPESKEDVVYRYFKLISDKDLEGILDLFDDDATIYEPFSKTEGLHGRASIEPFLKVAMMANSNMRRKIQISKPEIGQPADQLTALVTFEKGDKTKARFTFSFEPDVQQRGWKIKTLDIRFTG